MPQPLLKNCWIRIESENARSLVRTSNVPASGLSFDTLFFTNLPENLGTSKQANVTSTNILGRSETIKTYGSSQGRSWNLDLQFFAEEPGKAAIEQAVVSKVNWCESLVYPIYTNGLSHGIPRLLFKFGDYLSVIVICTSVTTNIAGPWSVTRSTRARFGNLGTNESLGDISLPLYATVNLVLEDIGEKSWGHADVKGGLHNGPRGVGSGGDQRTRLQ